MEVFDAAPGHCCFDTYLGQRAVVVVGKTTDAAADKNADAVGAQNIPLPLRMDFVNVLIDPVNSYLRSAVCCFPHCRNLCFLDHHRHFGLTFDRCFHKVIV